MQQIVYYPCLVHETYWQVAYDESSGSGVLRRFFTRIAVCTTDEREAREKCLDLEAAGLSPQFARYDEAYFPRCGVCGESVYDTVTRPVFSWDDVVQWVRLGPVGWLTTSEQLVFCPSHRPADAEE